MSGRLSRLYHGETTVDFYGRRRLGFIVSGVLLVVFVVSLIVQGLNLGIDFRGGVALEVPATATMDVEAARTVLVDSKVEAADSAKIQTLSSGETARVRIQLGDMSAESQDTLRAALAKKAGVGDEEVSAASVSSSWGRNVTQRAILALAVFLVLVSAFIAWRFEWRMAAGAISAVIHDVLISVGVYSLFGLEVSPATVVAFLTILGYSLYDTIVVFDKVDDNVRRFSGARVSYGDIVNVSMNQVLMRSLNTSISSVLPVISLYVLGSVVFGAVALRDFSLALIVGLTTGAYSSIYIAAPVLGILRERSREYSAEKGRISRGPEMAVLMATGAPASRRSQARTEAAGDAGSPVTAGADQTVSAVETLLSHPPRPRKKSRR
ncbi:MAG: protein translocase subunit SecF [Actinomycetota bacterium]